jgi:uncharacterized protein
MTVELSRAEARRLALSSLGFGAKKPAKAGTAHVRATAKRLSAIQIDSVNVLARAHYMPVFSRYGPYPTSALDDLAHGKRELFEYWGHAACFLPIELYPHWRWRMDAQAEGWAGLDKTRLKFIEAVFEEVGERGPLSAGQLSDGGKSRGTWWGWSDGKAAIEYLFRQGRVAIAGRRNFQRLYDIPERVFPREVLKAKSVPARKSCWSVPRERWAWAPLATSRCTSTSTSGGTARPRTGYGSRRRRPCCSTSSSRRDGSSR